MRLIVATRNPGKLEEVKQIFIGSDVEVVGMTEMGVVGEVKEDGDILFDNACKKAKFARSTFPQYWVAADGSGLFVKGLNGRSGVHSARWAGECASTEEIMKFTLKKMAGISVGKRQAYMETLAVLFPPGARHGFWDFQGILRGEVALQPCGKIRPGMPYDPIFIPDRRDSTLAELPVEIKNEISHRAKAFKMLKDFLENCVKHKLA